MTFLKMTNLLAAATLLATCALASGYPSLLACVAAVTIAEMVSAPAQQTAATSMWSGPVHVDNGSTRMPRLRWCPYQRARKGSRVAGSSTS